MKRFVKLSHQHFLLETLNGKVETEKMLRHGKTIGAQDQEETMIGRPVTTEVINWMNRSPFWDLIGKRITIDSFLLQKHKYFIFQIGFVFRSNFRYFSNTIIIWMKPIPETKIALIPLSFPNFQKRWVITRFFLPENQLRRNLKAGKQTLRPYAIVSLERLLRERYKHVSERTGLQMFENLIFC